MLPIRLPVGGLLDLNNIVVTDVFGQRSCIKHYNKVENGKATDPNWSFFKLDKVTTNVLDQQTDNRLLIPPVLLDLQESKPLEEVNFTRDEMANFVWAIETIVADGLGKGINGNEFADLMAEYFLNLAEVNGFTTEVEGNDSADIMYRMANTIPENWIPFIPKKVGNQSFKDIQFQRAAMPRIVPGFDPRRVRPLTNMLRVGLDKESKTPYFICEEEIPRAGVIVRQTWQRARWHNGKIALWPGYRKVKGRGESASGLKFDEVLAKDQ